MGHYVTLPQPVARGQLVAGMPQDPSVDFFTPMEGSFEFRFLSSHNHH